MKSNYLSIPRRIWTAGVFAGMLTWSGAVLAADGHDHPDHGPHGGTLIELGDEEYHGELVHDEDDGIVKIYLLDSSAKKGVKTDAAEVFINVRRNRKPLQFKLPAVPTKADGGSEFASKDKKLAECLEDEKADSRLRVVVKGRAYVGKIAPHHHDHDHKAEKKK